jgi:hypothetical protein
MLAEGSKMTFWGVDQELSATLLAADFDELR